MASSSISEEDDQLSHDDVEGFQNKNIGQHKPEPDCQAHLMSPKTAVESPATVGGSDVAISGSSAAAPSADASFSSNGITSSPAVDSASVAGQPASCEPTPLSAVAASVAGQPASCEPTPLSAVAASVAGQLASCEPTPLSAVAASVAGQPASCEPTPLSAVAASVAGQPASCEPTPLSAVAASVAGQPASCEPTPLSAVAASVAGQPASCEPTPPSAVAASVAVSPGPIPSPAAVEESAPRRVQLPETVAAAESHVSDTAHHIKWLQFHGARSPVITQNVNGPCPLLALINVMLLKGKVQLPPSLEVITIGQLMDYIGDTMLDSAADQSLQPDFQQNMQDAVAILPKLQTGLDVNVKFSGVQEFEYTPECCIFDLLHVRLYHGWLVEPAEPDVQRAVAQCGYNQLVDSIITNKSSSDPQLCHQALLAENFLESTASQLTVYGLTRLRQTMRDGELAVFFRNNHFSTIYRYQDVLYLLVTDQGFLREPRVVWETLTSTDGAGQFVDGNFEPLSPERPPAVNPQQVDQDYLVALSLQEESSRQQAQDIQWQEYKHAEFGTNAEVLSDAELARRLQEEEERGAQQQQQQQQEQQQQQQEQQQQQQQRRQQLDSTSRSESKRKTCAVM